MDRRLMNVCGAVKPATLFRLMCLKVAVIALRVGLAFPSQRRPSMFYEWCSVVE
jgi:hypothetical protein